MCPHVLLCPPRLRQASASSEGSLEAAQARLRERDQEVGDWAGLRWALPGQSVSYASGV
jgi:hypothetical protein